MDYDLYHDESMVAGYWHGMLLIPQPAREQLLNELINVRRNLRYEEPVRLGGLNKPSGKQYRCVEAWLSIGVCALAQQLGGDPLPYMTGSVVYDSLHRRAFEYRTLQQILGAKFILFRVRDGHSALAMDYPSNVETTLRMGLKGGLHLLGNPGHPIHLTSFHFDGHEHLGRHVDHSRIVDRIINLREYCSFANPLHLDDRTSDHRKPDCQEYSDCQLLQLADLLVGSFRTILGEPTHAMQRQVSYPVLQLVERWKAGPARMRNSRWNGGLSISQCHLENDSWQFEDIDVPQNHSPQPTLFDDVETIAIIPGANDSRQVQT